VVPKSAVLDANAASAEHLIMPLFEVQMVASKTFYVEAATQDEALQLSEDETDACGTEYEYEFDEATAKELPEAMAVVVRQRRPGKVLNRAEA
jgi:hypothetical protein